MIRPFLLVIFLVSIFSLSAQVSLDLEECLKLAHDRNLSLMSSQLTTDMADVDLSESRQARLPNLNANAGASYYAGRGIDPTTNDFISQSFISNDISLGSAVTLFAGGRITQQINRSKAEVKRAKALQEQIFNDISLQVVESYLQVLSDQENVRNAQAQVVVSQNQKGDLQKLINAGVRAPNDILDLEVQLLNDEQALVSAENTLQLDLLRLKQIIRWEGEENIRLAAPPDGLLEGLSMDNYSLDELVASALRRLPEVKASEASLESSEIGLKQARSAYYPSLTANAFLVTQYSDAAKAFTSDFEWVPLDLRINGQPATVEVFQPVINQGETIPLTDQWDANLGYGGGLSLTIPIYNRGVTSSATQRAKIGISQSKIEVKETRDRIRQLVESAYTSARNAQKNYEASSRSLTATQAAFENTQKRYTVGAATNLELASAKTLFENAQRIWTTSKYTYILNMKVLDFYMGKKLTF